ncbi:hypothetical protein PUN28_007706 [Cardiocondyla obscurior]|uniref:Uncharacterized protein n=1 Tax=Cardiocondyla obscurior TaxID=286306 RepID=A0AAW2FZU9_9HYME
MISLINPFASTCARVTLFHTCPENLKWEKCAISSEACLASAYRSCSIEISFTIVAHRFRCNYKLTLNDTIAPGRTKIARERYFFHLAQ